MAITRADTLTQNKKNKEVYSDFFDDFVKSPFGGDLALQKNEKAVKQSIKKVSSGYGTLENSGGNGPEKPSSSKNGMLSV